MSIPTIKSMKSMFYCLFLYSRAHLSRRDGEGAAQAPPATQNVHVNKQDPSHGLSPLVPGSSALWCLLRRLQEQAEEGGFPLHRRQLVLRGDGNCAGMWLLQVPVVTATPVDTVCKGLRLISVTFCSGKSIAAIFESYTPTRLPLETLSC